MEEMTKSGDKPPLMEVTIDYTDAMGRLHGFFFGDREWVIKFVSVTTGITDQERIHTRAIPYTYVNAVSHEKVSARRQEFEALRQELMELGCKGPGLL